MMEGSPNLMFARAALIFVSLFASAAAAAPTIDPQFGSHAVIQRGKPVTVSGAAAPGEHITVSFAGEVSHFVADHGGAWRASFPAHDAGGPYKIEVGGTGGASATSDDVMVGDVWL